MLLKLALWQDVECGAYVADLPLWRELEFLRLYLSIEQVRFEDRLRVRIAPTGLSDVLVPHMVLQPIRKILESWNLHTESVKKPRCCTN